MGRETRTIRDLLRLASRDAARAWAVVERAAERVVARLRRKYRLDDTSCADLAHDAMFAAMKHDLVALRRARSGAPLEAWLTVTAKNLLLQRRRKERTRGRRGLQQVDEAVETSDDEELEAPEAPAPERVAELLDLLPPEQRRVEAALMAGRSERNAAKLAGSSRDHVHEVRQRAEKRMRKGERWTAPDVAAERAWALAAAARCEAKGDATNAQVLRLHAEGRTRREIAAALALTPAAVRDRIHRARMQA